MMAIHFKDATFIKSAAYYDQCVPDEGREVAFVGRSNAGKSSSMNALIGSKQVRVSKTPGRTQLINFFSLAESLRLVDLPGYGYADVPVSVKERWENTLNDYFLNRQSLVGVVMLCDTRHLMKKNDLVLLNFILSLSIPVHILLTKSDKLSKSAAKSALMAAHKALEGVEGVTMQLFSALTLVGVEELKQQLQLWLLGPG